MSNIDKICNLCGTQAEYTRLGIQDAYSIKCLRCGTYEATGSWCAITSNYLGSDFPNNIHLISAWTRIGSEENNLIRFHADSFQKVAETLIHRAPKTVSEKLELLLSRLAKKLKYPGDAISLQHGLDFPLAYAQNGTELGYLLVQLRDSKYIFGQIDFEKSSVGLTAEGRKKHEESRNKGHDSNQCFLAMWFDDSMNDAREEGFLPAIRSAGFDPMVIDEKPHNGKICEEIIHEIKKSKFVVADVTGSRGGVYYEAGYAKALGKEVIWTCHADRFDQDLHFDTRQYNHIKWTTPLDLKEQLEDRILGTIGRGKNYKD